MGEPITIVDRSRELQLSTSSAAELRRVPREQRDAILATAAVAAESDYLLGSDLTAFEAFGEEDF